MNVFGSRLGWWRGTAIVLCALVAAAAVATIVLDGEEEPFGPRDSLLPSFSAGYECADPRDQLTAEHLSYRLRYADEHWVASVRLAASGDDLRGPCSVQLGVPPRSADSGGDANVSIERDGSPESGVATVPFRRREYTMDVTLPKDFDLFHSLGFGRHLFEFRFFAPGEGGSFKQATLEVSLPDGYSIAEALPPGNNPGSDGSRKWTLKADRDQRAAVTFEQDTLRSAVDLAPEVAFGALVLIAALLSFPQRREVTAEAGEETETQPLPEAAPVAAAVEEWVPGPEPEPEPTPASLPEPAPEPMPAAQRQPEPMSERTQAPLPEPEPQPEQVPEPAPRFVPPPPPAPVPSRAPAAPNRAARAAGAGAGLLAAALFFRLLRRRRGR